MVGPVIPVVMAWYLGSVGLGASVVVAPAVVVAGTCTILAG
jgi:hypothetical protein